MTIDKFIKENRELFFEILKELCAIPAPSNHEEKRAEYCRGILEKFGYENVYIDAANNVVCPVNCEDSREITVVSAHTDTVFADTEPMPYRVEDGKIFCPGVGDDTASITVMLLMAKYWKEIGYIPRNGVLLVCNSGEEVLGNLKGTRRIMADYEGRIRQFIALDSNIHSIANRCVGSHRFSVEVATEGGHSYLAFGNKNAIAEAAKIIDKIYQISIPQTAKTTYNVGVIEGGTAPTAIAEACKFLCEYRSEDIKCLEFMRVEFEEIFENARTGDVTVSVKQIGERPCGAEGVYDKIKGLEAVCEEVIKGIIGKTPIYESSSTDCNLPLSMGIPAICIGVFEGGGVHTREEWIDAESMMTGFEVLNKIMEKLV